MAVRTAADAFDPEVSVPASGESHEIFMRLTRLWASKLTMDAWGSLARNELKTIHAEFYGFNVGKPLTAEGHPVRYGQSGWKIMQGAGVVFGKEHGHPRNGWLGKIHEALSDL